MNLGGTICNLNKQPPNTCKRLQVTKTRFQSKMYTNRTPNLMENFSQSLMNREIT
jgi:hypothetical protein